MGVESRAAPHTSPPTRTREEELRRNVCFFFIYFLLGAVAWLVFLSLGSTGGSWKTFLMVLGTLGIFSAAALIVGGFFGFLFGIPRSLATGTGIITGIRQASGNNVVRFRPNTNLEQISDWLTKVLIGASLTQLGRLSAFAADVSDAIANALPGGQPNVPVCVATLVAFSVSGFLWAYFESRTSLMAVFNEWSSPSSQSPSGGMVDPTMNENSS